ncbi:hypothetical protein LCI18_004197 [Fusarium solani-melongenae]|uniref:Uncharacterized protein n=1 Tax=Fusarium solani subsp. cucurbitae TaxID=2747967 RepID=A0ACD3YWL5_FUSSC|nr:hypothetical protein LCI18_004197 [Fusarium solani-melongenae]
MSTNTTLPPGYEPPSYATCDKVTDRCPVEASLYGAYFSLGGCVFFVVAYGIALIAQVWLGIKGRTWSYSIWLAIGTLFELIGYAGRAVMSQNPWVYNAFVIQLVLLILGPTLVAAAISVTFKHLVLWYGRQYSFIKPVLYPWVFVGSDLFSIVIQAAGGGVSSVATGGEEVNQSLLDAGSSMLIAGVVFQMANMVFCGGLMLLYIWRRRRAIKNGSARLQSSAGEAGPTEDPTGAIHTRASDKKTKTFVYVITVAYIAIIIRCIYRIPEMEMGWGSDLMQNETTFMILDGAMILASVWLLTIFHPHFYFPFLSKKSKKEMPVDKPQEGVGTPELHEMGAVLNREDDTNK